MAKERFKPKEPSVGDTAPDKLAKKIGEKFRVSEKRDESAKRKLGPNEIHDAEELSRRIGAKFKMQVEASDGTKCESSEKSGVRSKHKGLEQISWKDVEGKLTTIDEKKWEYGRVREIVSDLSRSLPESSTRVFFADLKEVLPDNALRELENDFQKGSSSLSDRISETSSKEVDLRVGLVDGRVYFWKRDANPVNLINGYGDLYFYFKDKETLNSYLNDVNLALNRDSSTIARPTARSLDEILTQLVPESENTLTNTTRYNRILGKHLQLLNDISGRNLASLEGQISRVVKRSGRGGIETPRFPEGKELEIALAKVTGVAVTDCHLKPNGTLAYTEPELKRIRIVENDLQKFGAIRLNLSYDQQKHVYTSHFPTPIGNILFHLGMPYGNRSIQNPGLFPEIHSFCKEALSQFVGEVVPQDGTVKPGRISWSHSNALKPGRKGNAYRIKAVVGDSEIDFIKKQGKREAHGWVLGLGKINKLAENQDFDISQMATDIKRILYENRNSLIDDSLKITEKLGIKMNAKPYTVRHYERTGKVSVAWRIFTIDWIEAMKLAMVAPPNDFKKRKILCDWIRRNPDKEKTAIDNLANSGIYVDDWWNEYEHQ